MNSRQWIAWLFLLPNFVGFLLFTSIPLVMSFGMAFCSWDPFTPAKFTGFKNFVDLIGFHTGSAGGGHAWFIASLSLTLVFGALIAAGNFLSSRPLRVSGRINLLLVAGMLAFLALAAWNFIQRWEPNNPRFWYYLYNTLFLMLGIPVNMAGSLFLAILLNQKLSGRVLFRLLVFIPSIVGGVGVLILWKWIFNPDFGLFNNCLKTFFNLDGPKWLLSTAWAKPAFIIMGFWGSVGGANMILYLAALQSVDPQLYEAARIDGANFWQHFYHITLPLVSPTTFFILVMSIIGGFEGGFDAAYVMTKGGPAGSTTTLSYYIYQNAFQFFNMGKAAAASWLLFAMVLVFTLLNWRYGGRRVHYY